MPRFLGGFAVRLRPKKRDGGLRRSSQHLSEVSSAATRMRKETFSLYEAPSLLQVRSHRHGEQTVRHAARRLHGHRPTPH